MGTSASAQEFITASPTHEDPMYHGHHRRRSVQYPQSRGPRSFDQVPNISVSAPVSRSVTGQPPGKIEHKPVNEGASTSSHQGGTSGQGSNLHLANCPSPYKEEEIVFETFHHRDGDDYTCVYTAGERFYISSWVDGIWLPFPLDWYLKGVLVTDNIVTREENPALANDILMQLSYGQSNCEDMNQDQNTKNIEDDREGWVMHPSKGNVPTYLFEKKQNVHCFFDEVSGQWVKLPLALELQSDSVAEMVTQIEKNVEGWTDKHDILAALRASNYDVQDCVRNRHLAAGNLSSLSAKASIVDQRLLQSKEIKIQELEMKLKESGVAHEMMNKKLAQVKASNDYSMPLISALEEKVATLEVALKTARLQTASLTLPSRPKTAAQQSRIELKSVQSLAHNSSLFQQSYNRLRKDVVLGFSDCNKLLESAVVAAMKLPRMSDLVSSQEMEGLKALYRKECLQRKLLYNKLQELRGNIRVYARCRKDSSNKCALDFPSDEDVELLDVRGNKQRFRFDKVYSPETTQEQVFEDTCPIVTSCVDGYNICILAYGQTGSGKTFTMMGPPNNPGVNIRAIQELLKITDERKNIEYQLSLSMIEIYNDTIHDLLTADCKVVTVQQVGNSVTMQGLTSHIVNTKGGITEFMNTGMANRTVAATKMNSESSRSHLLVMLTVEGRDLSSNSRTKGTLTLVDLAGSERVSKSEVTGQQFVEAAAINRSLSSLGQVFNALGKSALHVPYRNSKLTQVLQPSLSGDAKAALYVALSPAEANLPETLSTLTFGSNAKQIELGKAKKNVTKGE